MLGGVWWLGRLLVVSFSTCNTLVILWFDWSVFEVEVIRSELDEV